MTDVVNPPPLTGDALKAKTYADEAARRRISEREATERATKAEEENKKLKDEIAALAAKQGGGATGNEAAEAAGVATAAPASPPPPDDEEATIWSELEQVLEANAQARRRGILTAVLGGLGAISPDDAADLLVARNLVSFGDGGVPTLNFGGETLPLDAKTIGRVLGPHNFRSSGVPGSGSSRVVHVGGDGQVIDLDRAKVDLQYFDRNKTAIKEALRARLEGGHDAE